MLIYCAIARYWIVVRFFYTAKPLTKNFYTLFSGFYSRSCTPPKKLSIFFGCFSVHSSHGESKLSLSLYLSISLSLSVTLRSRGSFGSQQIWNGGGSDEGAFIRCTDQKKAGCYSSILPTQQQQQQQQHN